MAVSGSFHRALSGARAIAGPCEANEETPLDCNWNLVPADPNCGFGVGPRAAWMMRSCVTSARVQGIRGRPPGGGGAPGGRKLDGKASCGGRSLDEISRPFAVHVDPADLKLRSLECVSLATPKS
mmetsp:Transcript_3351/g.8670  ORF Transcript_3351/g.8670 Transcript_3351/m.8670 type:complete len:125 (+) Transcript_3351:41-415(+)